MRQTTNGQINT